MTIKSNNRPLFNFLYFDLLDIQKRYIKYALALTSSDCCPTPTCGLAFYQFYHV